MPGIESWWAFHQIGREDETVTLKEAQKEIATDWVAAYKKYIGPLKPFKTPRRSPSAKRSADGNVRGDPLGDFELL